MIRALLSVLVLANTALAVDCVDFFAIQHKGFPVKVAKHAGKYFDCLSYLDNTFGTSKKALKAYLNAAKDRPHIIVVHATNETCRRYAGVCKKYDFAHKLSVNQYNSKLASKNKKLRKKLIKLYKRIKNEIAQLGNANTRLIIGLGLESQYTKDAYVSLVEYAKTAGIEERNILYNPVHNSPHRNRGGFSDVIVEFHYRMPDGQKPYAVSHDGFRPDYCGSEAGSITGNRLSDSEVRAWSNAHRQAAIKNGAWCGLWQGLQFDSNSGLKPPRERTIYATRGVLDRYRTVTNMGGPSVPQPPAGNHDMKKCSAVKQWYGGYVIKESDHSGVVFLGPKKYKRVVIVEPGGKKYKLNYTGAGNPMGDGTQRHHYRLSKPWASFAENSVIKARFRKLLIKKTDCFKTFLTGMRYGS